MNVRHFLTLGTLSLLGCQGRDQVSSVPTEPRPARSVAPPHGSATDFDFAAAARSRTPVGQGARIAITNHAFRNGEVALAVRDPASPTLRTVVLSARQLNDHALFLAAAALELDERQTPLPAAVRVLHVWSDGRVETAAEGYVGRVDPSVLQRSRAAPLQELLRRARTPGVEADLPEVGRVRMLAF